LKPPTVRLCLGLILIACVAPGVLASVDPLEDIGPTYTVVTDRTIDGVTVTITTASGRDMLAVTYFDEGSPCFLGAGDVVNAPLVPGNVSGTRFISTADDIDGDMPIVFAFSEPIGLFGLTTVDVLEDVETSGDAEVRLQGWSGTTLLDEHVRTGIQAGSGLDLDWRVWHAAGLTHAVLLRTGGTISAGYGIDDLEVLLLSVPNESATWSRVKGLYR